MAKTNVTSTQFAAKKLLGKTQTRPSLTDAQEALPSNVSVPGAGVFAETLPREPGTEYFTMYSASAGSPATVERVYFDLVAIGDSVYDADASSEDGGEAGQNSATHAYYLKLPSNYETTSSNPNRGTGSFVNDKRLYFSRGALQLVPPFTTDAGLPGAGGNNRYFVEIYSGDPTNAANKISSTDAIDWQFDYYSGILFIQDSASAAPVTASAYLYTGKYLDEKLTNISSSSGANIIVKDEGSNITTNATSFDFVGAAVTATNSGNDVTVTLTSNVFSRTLVQHTMTASVNDRILAVNQTASLDIRLPAANGYTGGANFVVKDESGNANNFNITIRTTGADEIDGDTSIILQSPYAAVNIYSNGANKFFVY
tara:strand:- start:1555 stop:2664 length:1110 start_codon:yes stop_codon:yes gene_type:complete